MKIENTFYPRTAPKGAVCQLHDPSNHRPFVHQHHLHHVLPLGMGGKQSPNNTIVVCPTSHYNIHMLIDEYVRTNGNPGWEFLKHFGHEERYWALSAWVAFNGGE